MQLLSLSLVNIHIRCVLLVSEKPLPPTHSRLRENDEDDAVNDEEECESRCFTQTQVLQKTKKKNTYASVRAKRNSRGFSLVIWTTTTVQ